MDASEKSAVSSCPTDSSTGLDTRAPWGIKLRPRRAINRCARCHNHGATDQIKDHKHLCLFQTCKCRKCARFSEHCKVSPAESTLKRQRGAHGKRRPTRGLKRAAATPPTDHSSVNKLANQGGVLNNLPSASTGWSGPRYFVSVLDSSSLEEATDNFSFQEFTQASRPAQHKRKQAKQGKGLAQATTTNGQQAFRLPRAATANSYLPLPAGRWSYVSSRGFNPPASPFLVSGCSALILQPCATFDHLLLQPFPLQAPMASDQASVSASSEWQRKLEAAEALLILRDSPQPPPGYIPPLYCVLLLRLNDGPGEEGLEEFSPAGDTELQPPRPSLHPRPATTSVSLPLGHPACTSLLSWKPRGGRLTTVLPIYALAKCLMFKTL
ncbi:doublesex- and mab-3-related transcription factor C2-like [Pteropus medius]|uniref:doublesex- and mab-3-related transcription factor C2-like n=1 Tax=Pteropus vampyrus TaxID=132908 RepID=UPI00196A208A|nr:doublesex- and mab-3-related transcription factor C2-like [Pteropus giganteus]